MCLMIYVQCGIGLGVRVNDMSDVKEAWRCWNKIEGKVFFFLDRSVSLGAFHLFLRCV